MSKNLSSRIARLEASAKEPEPLRIDIAFVQPGGKVTHHLILEDGVRTELPAADDDYSASALSASAPRSQP